MVRRLLKQLLSHERGVALIEFAVVFPVFFLLLFGGIEVSRFILIQQKLEKSGYVLADIVTQYQPATKTGATGEISKAEFTINVFPQFSRIMAPYDDLARQAVIVTSIRKTATNDKTIAWQIAGGGALSDPSVKSIVNGLSPSAVSPAVAGATPSFPAPIDALINGYTPLVGDANIIVTEMFYRYQPILQPLLQGVGGADGLNFFLSPQIFVKRTYTVPRSEVLFDLPPDFPVP